MKSKNKWIDFNDRYPKNNQMILFTYKKENLKTREYYLVVEKGQFVRSKNKRKYDAIYTPHYPSVDLFYFSISDERV